MLPDKLDGFTQTAKWIQYETAFTSRISNATDHVQISEEVAKLSQIQAEPDIEPEAE